ncbi:MAG: hypothetical protein IAE77_01450 [Prosthecobacter sp.]|jgi:hypothetical protein|uniref:hypothetical protein n=1 Tax=Prosthecobacter sp. TaxID=1965333 RepID=UPI0019EA32E3|nr:hypothetical protein [Prosthecobacter sp.]MBE2282107.1 hypothetical protein [Prosthecobacter sp.]
MSHTEAALENLRIIRSLMEKAHIYRAVSAPAALTGGALALAASIWPVWHAVANQGAAAMCDRCFLFTWLIILGIASGLNVILLAKEARRRGQPFVSEGMRMALRAFAPPMLVGGMVGIGLILFLHNLTLAALIWVLCYGLALLATAGFSPRSLVRLGWGFVIAGLLLFLVWALNRDVDLLSSDLAPASLVMGLTFGLLHVIYALAVFFSPKPAQEAAK